MRRAILGAVVIAVLAVIGALLWPSPTFQDSFLEKQDPKSEWKGKFVVKARTVTKEEFLESILQGTTLEYCKQFAEECAEGKTKEVYEQIEQILLETMNKEDLRPEFIRLTYHNGTNDFIDRYGLEYRTPTGTWINFGRRNRRFRQDEQLLKQKVNAQPSMAQKVWYSYFVAQRIRSQETPLPPGATKTWAYHGMRNDMVFQIDYQNPDNGHYTTRVYVNDSKPQVTKKLNY